MYCLSRMTGSFDHLLPMLVVLLLFGCCRCCYQLVELWRTVWVSAGPGDDPEHTERFLRSAG